MKVNPVGKAFKNTMKTEENDRGDKYGKAQETDSEWGDKNMESPQWMQGKQRREPKKGLAM